MRLRLISSLTDSIRYPLDFSSPKVRGRSVIITLLRLNVESIREQPIKKGIIMLGRRGEEVNETGRGADALTLVRERDY